jgi:hypothetical protein
MQRRDARWHFRGELDVIVAGRSGWARGRDISAHGACFACEFKVARGDALQVDLSTFGMGIRGAIVRHARIEKERYVVGVEFFGPLTSEELTLLINERDA